MPCAGCADGVQYVRDVCLTLAAFLAALPSAAELLLGPEAGLIAALAAAHDELVPQMQAALMRAAYVDEGTVAEVWPSGQPLTQTPAAAFAVLISCLLLL